MAIDVDEATFEREMVERSRQVPVVVDFWAEWCERRLAGLYRYVRQNGKSAREGLVPLLEEIA